MGKMKNIFRKDEVVYNPAYSQYKALWTTQIDSFEGQPRIKDGGETYLPMPSGKIPDKVNDARAVSDYYSAYKQRAVFPEILQEAVDSMVGQVFEDFGIVELPEALKYLLKTTSASGEGLNTTMRFTLQRQLVTGRILALWKIDVNTSTPKIVFYDALSICDWHTDATGNLIAIVLDESGNQYIDGKWEWVKNYRVIGIDGNLNYYNAQVKDTSSFDFSKPPGAVYDTIHRMPYRGEIPGVIFNSTTLGGTCEKPITYKITSACLSAYMNSADYEQSLHITAQPTFYALNAKVDEGQKLCLGSACSLSVDNPEASPEIGFLEITGVGLEALDKSIETHKQDARKNIELIENAAEAGVALNTRLAVKTASLQNVALTLEQGWQKLLDIAAKWMKTDATQIRVKVKTDFRKDTILPQDLVQLAALIATGQYSKKDFYAVLKKSKLTFYDDYEAWNSATEANGIISTIMKDVDNANSE